MRRSLIPQLAIYGFYLLVAVIITYPLIAHLSTEFVGFINGDGYEMAHHIWWFKYAIQTQQPLFFQPLSAYPNGLDGITLWSDPLQFFPAWLFAFVMPLASAANLADLLTLALNGWAMFYLARYLINSQSTIPVGAQRTAPLQADSSTRAGFKPAPTNRAITPALLAGLVFMLYPTMQGHLGAGHGGLIVQWPVPLYVYALLRLRERGGLRGILLASIFFFLSATGHSLQVIYVLMPITIVYGLLLIGQRDWIALRRAVIGVLIGAIVLGLFLLPVLRATIGTSAYTDAGGNVAYSDDLLSIVTPSFFNPLFSHLDFTRRVLGVNLNEGVAYIGIITAILSLIAVWKVKAARWWLALALVAWVLALGPLLKIFDQPVTYSVDGYVSYVTLPYALIANLPLINLERTPGRFGFALALALAALAGYGAAYLWAHVRASRAIKMTGLAILMLLIAFEYQVFWPLPTTPAIIPQPIADLSQDHSVRAIFDIPWENFNVEREELYLQTGHQRPLIAGHVTRGTPVSPAKLTLLESTLDPALLKSVGADVVILHRTEVSDGTLEALAKKQLGKPVYEDDLYAVFRTPATEAAPAFIAQSTTVTSLTDQADSYVYAPQDGWVTFQADLSGSQRSVDVLLDGQIAQRLTVDGTTSINLPLPVSADAFQTISLALDPACPAHFDPALECRSLAISNVKISYSAAPAVPSTAFEHGVTLARANLPATASAGQPLNVWLWWQFAQPLDQNDIRFVHVTDASGKLIAQQDNPLGSIKADEARADAVSVVLPADLPPGTYTVSAGWYTYPDITNFKVLSSGAGTLTLGTIEVGS
ncbi:MAG TPA: hypothetical protein VHD90_00155 [Phototrophicaceae bacterium]|nr:hypothetical protein [Phototrophicaceae bacterium]